MNPKRPNPTKPDQTVDRNPYDEASERRQADDRAADRGGHNINGGVERDPSTPFER